MNQPEPSRNNSTPIWDLVMVDMKNRDQLGRLRYGTPLQTFNGRNALWDAYEEALDLAVYLRQEIEERRISVKNKCSSCNKGLMIVTVREEKNITFQCNHCKKTVKTEVMRGEI